MNERRLTIPGTELTLILEEFCGRMYLTVQVGKDDSNVLMEQQINGLVEFLLTTPAAIAGWDKIEAGLER